MTEVFLRKPIKISNELEIGKKSNVNKINFFLHKSKFQNDQKISILLILCSYQNIFEINRLDQCFD